ncbi:MAG: LamG-like jellyroll fold domain-containing protein, partial [Candidatus Paceibacterota bacterium]
MKKTLLSLIFVLFLASPVYASTNQPQLDQLASVITSLQSIVDSLQNLVSTSFQSVSTNFSANSSSQLAALDGSGSGLVGWWKFDEGSGTIAADSSGNSNTGTLMPATTPPSWTTGQLGQALSFNGLNYIMGTKVLSIGVSAITFSAWVFPRSNGPTGYGVVISNGYAYLATGGPSSTRWIFSHNYGATSGSAGNNSITLNKWQHVVVVRKSSGLITFYINGNQIGTADQNIGVAADGNNAWRIGSRADGNYFDGLIDEVRVYDRDLSASEVSQLYTLGNEVSNGSPATYSLSITNAGNGTVSSNPAGLNCGSTCSISGITSGATYTLTAAPDVNYSSSWSGCSPSANNDTCTVVVNGNTTVTVIFASASSPAPVITSVSASNITATGATLTWTTDQLSDSQADYGTTASYGNSTAIGTTLSTSHSITLSGLTANTLYHYRVYSKNASGVITRSGDNTFTTSQQVSQASGNIYIAQNAQGSNSGADCDNAHSVAWLNTYGSWGTGMGQIGPATTVHLCGTISSFLNIRGSGSPGSPITIFFENNAKLSSPTWTSSSIIYMSNKNWITIDGGTNGVVEATDNGTGVQYGGNFNNQKGFNAVYGENLSHVTIQNLNIRNLYVRKPSSLDPVLSGSSSVMCGGIIIIIGSDIIVRNNRISDAGELIGINWGAGATNITVDNNILLNTNHAITIANNSAGGSLTNLTISRNKIDGLDVWEGGENFHRNGLFLFTNYVDSTITNIYVYNNHVGPGINPQTGTAGTGGLDNQRPLAPGMFKNVYVFNNIADLKAPLKWSQAFIGIAGENSLIANNTVVGWSDSSGCYGGPGIAVGGIGGRAEAYNNLVNCTGSMMVHSVYEGYPFTNVLSDYNLFNNEGFKRYASFLTLVNTKGGWDTAINNAWYEFATWQASLTSNRDPHSLNIDPQLVNANTSNGDYHLQSTSPARNAGINLTSYCTIIPQLCFDYDNNPRPSTGPWTIGAYEYVSGGAPTPVNGSCSITINQCATGSFSDTTDTSTNYLW